METLVEGKYGTGGYIDSYDSRDFKLSEVAGATTPFNWQLGFDVEKQLNYNLVVKNQGSSSSCGGQSWSYLSEVLEALGTGTYEPRSAKYIYAQTAVQGGGSYGRDNCAVLESQGVCQEKTLPSYPNTEINLTAAVDITAEVREDAKKAIFLPYAHADNDIESIAQAIRDHNGVILGVEGDNNGTWASKFPKPPKTVKWRHWVYALGAELINGKKYIKILNSWGESVGENGRQWLGEDYFISKHIFDNWTHIYKVQDIPKPLFLIDMQYGQTMFEIKRLQDFLVKLGYLSIDTTTTYYGNQTKEAVFKFQQDYVKMSWYEKYWLRGSKVGEKTRLSLNKLL